MNEEVEERYFIVSAIGLKYGDIKSLENHAVKYQGGYLNRVTYERVMLDKSKNRGIDLDSYTIMNITEITEKDYEEYTA
jgi:hypothetical protein